LAHNEGVDLTPNRRDTAPHLGWRKTVRFITHVVGVMGICAIATMSTGCTTTDDKSPATDTTTKTTLTYHQDIQPIYDKHCSFCHAGCSPDTCAGGTCFVTYYEALFYAAPICGEEMNVAECGLYRIEFTKTSDGPNDLKLLDRHNAPIIVPDADIATIAQWISQGMPLGTPPPPPDAGCVPNCIDKECGCDGCGGLCEGGCEPGFYCQHAMGSCCIQSNIFGTDDEDMPGGDCSDQTACTPDCDQKVCGGSDGCGDTCPITCAGTCNPETHQCENCTPVCEGKMCGSDQCGGMCPYLCEDNACNQSTGNCVDPSDCTPDCEGKECGDDGCGGHCPNLCGTNGCDQDGKCNGPSD